MFSFIYNNVLSNQVKGVDAELVLSLFPWLNRDQWNKVECTIDIYIDSKTKNVFVECIYWISLFIKSKLLLYGVFFQESLLDDRMYETKINNSPHYAVYISI